MPVSSAHLAKTEAAIAILVVGSLLSSARMIFKAPLPGHVKPDVIAASSDERFAQLKKRLPANGVVGYIGESGDSATPDYYLTQYALVPLVVEDSTDHELVIGNFPSSQPPKIPQTLRLVDDLGNGVLLFANESKEAK